MIIIQLVVFIEIETNTHTHRASMYILHSDKESFAEKYRKRKIIVIFCISFVKCLIIYSFLSLIQGSFPC